MGLFRRSKQKDENIDKLKILFDRFEYLQLGKLCTDVIGRNLKSEGGEHPEKIQYLDFIWENYRKGVINFEQIRDFAIKQGIASQDFFD